MTDLITREEVAQLFRVSLAAVDKWRRNGILPAYVIGRTVRFSRAEVLSSMRKEKVQG